MSALQQSINQPEELDIKSTISSNRLLGLWRLMRGFRLQYVGANVALGISATSKTLTYLLLRYFIDDILAPGKYNLIPLAALGFVLLALFEGSTTSSRNACRHTAEGVTRRLRNYLFDHLQRLPFKYHSETSTGELIERCTSDVDAIRRFFADQAINVGRIVLLFVINFAALYSLNARLAFLSIIVVPFILVTSIIFFARITKAYEAYQEQEAVLSTTIQENLTGVRVVKAYARQEFEINKFEKENALKFAKGKTLMKMHSLFWPISDTFCGFQILAGFFLGAQMVINGTLTIGSYLAYAGLIIWLIFPLRTLGRVIVQMSTGLVSYTRVMKIIKEDRERLDAGTISPDQVIHGDIKFENVSFEYEKDNPILCDVSFECTSGQSVALLGSTGSGKTSLVNLLPRFYDVTSGAVYLDGHNINDYPIHYLREQIGIVEQEPFLFSRTIRENIVYGVERVVSDEEVYEAARAAAIHDVILSFPLGYATLVGEKGVTLSGGQKQRVTIARTLLKNPRILVLDDSTSSVDLETEAEIRQALENLMKNRTTFIIAHRIQSIMNADLILVFDKGGIIQRGTHKQLIGVPGVYQQIYELQTNIDLELEKEVSRVRL